MKFESESTHLFLNLNFAVQKLLFTSDSTKHKVTECLINQVILSSV